MSEVEAAWLAGVFDGEGCICWANRKFPKPTLVLQIGNTCRPLLERVQQVTGSGGITIGQRFKDKRREYFKWQISSSKAKSVLQQIERFLVVKRQRADLALRDEVWPIGFGLSFGKSEYMKREFGTETFG